MRPFLYPGFDWAYAKIDRDVERREKAAGREERAEPDEEVD